MSSSSDSDSFNKKDQSYEIASPYIIRKTMDKCIINTPYHKFELKATLHK